MTNRALEADNECVLAGRSPRLACDACPIVLLSGTTKGAEGEPDNGDERPALLLAYAHHRRVSCRISSYQ